MYPIGARIAITWCALVPRYLPNVPADSFDGRPLRYQVRGKGYAVYGINRNQIDDGGKRGQTTLGMNERGTDIVFEVKR